MKVKLINFTQEALELLILTKSSRLDADTTLEEIMSWPEEKKLEHLDYMMNTIKTSFEFVNYAFEIKGVSRAFTHQFVRTRTASFQQQSQRTVDASDFDVVKTSDHIEFDVACKTALECYESMIAEGVQVQDARGVLPTNICTEIMMSANLRTLSDMASLRLCKRTQGEYQDVFKLMVVEILKVHPWAAPLLEVHCIKNGFCAFPNYKKCPVQKLTFKLDDYKRNNIRKAWKDSTHVANPVANKDGMTM